MKSRNTPTREAVLNLLLKEGKAMSQDAIEKRIEIPIDRATVYRILKRCCDEGIVHKIVAEDGKQYFAACMSREKKKPEGYHFHFRCTQCQTIECLRQPVHYSVPEGYTVSYANCVLIGLCRKCSEEAST